MMFSMSYLIVDRLRGNLVLNSSQFLFPKLLVAIRIFLRVKEKKIKGYFINVSRRHRQGDG